MCSAVFRRMGDMGTTSTRSPGLVGGDDGRRWRAAVAAEPPSWAAASPPVAGGVRRRRCRSRRACRGVPRCGRGCRCLVTRPEMPVPGTWRMSTLCSAAILRTTGDERVWRSSSTRHLARAASRRGRRGGRRGCRGRSGAGARGPVRQARVEAGGVDAPSPAARQPVVPAAGGGRSSGAGAGAGGGRGWRRGRGRGDGRRLRRGRRGRPRLRRRSRRRRC